MTNQNPYRSTSLVSKDVPKSGSLFRLLLSVVIGGVIGYLFSILLLRVFSGIRSISPMIVGTMIFSGGVFGASLFDLVRSRRADASEVLIEGEKETDVIDDR